MTSLEIAGEGEAVEAILWAFDVVAMVVLVYWSARREKAAEKDGAGRRV